MCTNTNNKRINRKRKEINSVINSFATRVLCEPKEYIDLELSASQGIAGLAGCLEKEIESLTSLTYTGKPCRSSLKNRE